MLMATKSWEKLFESLKFIVLNIIQALILCLWPFQWTELLKNNTSIDCKEWGYKTSGVKWIWKSNQKSLMITLYYEKNPHNKTKQNQPTKQNIRKVSVLYTKTQKDLRIKEKSAQIHKQNYIRILLPTPPPILSLIFPMRYQWFLRQEVTLSK